mgnify:FL=1
MNFHQLLVNSQNKPLFTLTSTLLFAQLFHLKGHLLSETIMFFSVNNERP